MDINTDPLKIKEVLERGVEDVIDKNNLAKKMAAGKQLRIKLGIDPTGADIHLGHSVVLRKLRQFQELGHKAVLIIGDFTTLIGDPSGRTTSRPPLTEAQIRDNMKDYIQQASRVLDMGEAEVYYNREWFGQKPMSFLMDLAGRFTVARLIEREDFQKRLKDGLDVSMLELLYPLLQGYDSVAVKADVELGGYDQRLNLLFGRKVQRVFGQAEQDIITVPLLIGTDGEKKMSKSVGNYIKISEEPNKMFRQLMDINDSCIWDYFNLLTDIPQEKIEIFKKEVKEGMNPMEVKKNLAQTIVAFYSGEDKALVAKNLFDVVKQTVCFKITNIYPAQSIVDLLVGIGACKSKTEAKRLIIQNAIKIDGQLKNDCNEAIVLKEGQTIQVGKNKKYTVGLAC